MSSNLVDRGTRKVLQAALLSEAIRFCERKSGTKAKSDQEFSNQQFDKLYLKVEQILPEVIVTDGVAKISAKILGVDSSLSTLQGKFIKVNQWKMTIKNQRSLFEIDKTKKTKQILELKLEICEFEILNEIFDLKSSSFIDLEEIPLVKHFMDYFRHKHRLYLAKGMKKIGMPDIYNAIGDFEIKRKGNKIVKRERTGINVKQNIERKSLQQVPQVFKFPT